MEQIFAGQVRFGIQAAQQYVSYDEHRALWLAAEELGYDWCSVFDHFMPILTDPEGPCLEGPTLLAAMAAQTSRIRCGILVTGNTYRHPAVLANIAATIDHISGGRLELGIGAGWYETEHQQYGIPLPPIGRRIRMLGEAARIMRSLWTESRTSFDGRYYQLQDALCEPKPVQQPSIPLWVGGSGEQLTLRVVAESADGWNTFLIPEDAYRHKLDVLAGHCRDIGRDPASIRKSLSLQLIVGETQAEVDERIDRLTRGQGAPSLATLRPGAIAGTPEQCAEQILKLVDLGVGDFILSTRPPFEMRNLELVATKVAPIVRAERAAAP